MPDSPEVFTLRATATSDPFFRCAVGLQNNDSQPSITMHSCTTSGAQPGVVGVALAWANGSAFSLAPPGESAGPCGVLAPSLDVARSCQCHLIGLLRLFEGQENREGGVLCEINLSAA